MNDDARNGRAAVSSGGAKQPHRGEGRSETPVRNTPRPELAWNRPTIRMTGIGRTATGGHVWEKEAAGGWYHPES